LRQVNPIEQARRALANAAQVGVMRAELAEAVAALFGSVSLPKTPPPLTVSDKKRLVALGTLAARCRSAVERDSYSRAIELIPGAEAPGRLTQGLSRLLTGMIAVGVDHSEAWRVVATMALDCMPAVRRAVFEFLARRAPTLIDVSRIAHSIGY